MEEDERSRQPVYTIDPSAGNADLPSILDKTDPKSVAEMIRYKLMGKEYDDERQQWFLPQDAKPMLNERGIRSIMVDVTAVLNQNTTLSNVEDEHISSIIIGLGDTLVLKLFQRYKEFEIDIAELDTCVFSILNACFLCLRRSFHNLERVFHKATLSEIRHAIDGAPGTKRKGFGLFGGKS